MPLVLAGSFEDDMLLSELAGAIESAGAAAVEVAVLSATLRELQSTVSSLNLPYELILVDDGSTDGTWELIAHEARSNSSLRALRLSRRFGKEAALCAGLELSRGQATIVMDADLQHPPSMIPVMVDAWRSGAEIVEAVKDDRGDERLIDAWRARLFYGLLRVFRPVERQPRRFAVDERIQVDRAAPDKL